MEEKEQDSPDASVRRNARRFVWSNGLQNIGDQLVSGKTVLPWLFSAAGVPGFFTGLLVPIREAGSMLPQAALTPWVASHAARTRIWVAGSLGQALAAGGIAVAALTLRGAWLGLAVIACLALLSVCRALCSLAGKDVQGRTIPKGQRGRITGLATALGGAFTLATGALLAWLGELPTWGLAALMGLGVAGWALAAAIFAGIDEPVPDGAGEVKVAGDGIGKLWWLRLYRDEAEFRRFVNVRALLLVSALSTSFVVMLGSGLAGFVFAAGLANLLGGRITGLWSDRSSRTVMSYGAGFASLVIVGLVASATWAPVGVNRWTMPLGFFLISLAHTAIRVARKTYVVDMAGDDKRTLYVGAANTIMGIILLGVGAISAVIALAGPEAALLFLAAVGLIGTWQARALPEVSAHQS